MQRFPGISSLIRLSSELDKGFRQKRRESVARSGRGRCEISLDGARSDDRSAIRSRRGKRAIEPSRSPNLLSRRFAIFFSLPRVYRLAPRYRPVAGELSGAPRVGERMGSIFEKNLQGRKNWSGNANEKESSNWNYSFDWIAFGGTITRGNYFEAFAVLFSCGHEGWKSAWEE